MPTYKACEIIASQYILRLYKHFHIILSTHEIDRITNLKILGKKNIKNEKYNVYINIYLQQLPSPRS